MGTFIEIKGKLKKKEKENKVTIWCSFSIEELKKYVNDSGYINFMIIKRNWEAKNGNTHSAILSPYETKIIDKLKKQKPKLTEEEKAIKKSQKIIEKLKKEWKKEKQ